MKNELLIFFLISFILTWLCYIFWLEKDEFNFEFGKIGFTSGLVINTQDDLLVEELYEGRKTVTHEVRYVEYEYTVDGKTYKYGDATFGQNFSESNQVDIEYIQNSPFISRIKGNDEYAHNYFLRNLIPVIVISILVMFGWLETKKIISKIRLRKMDY